MKYIVVLFVMAVAIPVAAQKNPEKGKASYYATRFNGLRTASGELFCNDSLTAAHRTLPFGTKIKVTNIGNGKSVVVRVNDRGPHVKSRIVDLSQSASKIIDGIRAGIIEVTVEILE